MNFTIPDDFWIDMANEYDRDLDREADEENDRADREYHARVDDALASNDELAREEL